VPGITTHAQRLPWRCDGGGGGAADGGGVAVGPGQGESAHFSAYYSTTVHTSTVTIQYTACRKPNEKNINIYIHIHVHRTQ